MRGFSAKVQLLHAKNIVKQPVLKINQFCFYTTYTAEMHSFPAKLILDTYSTVQYSTVQYSTVYIQYIYIFLYTYIGRIITVQQGSEKTSVH